MTGIADKYVGGNRDMHPALAHPEGPARGGEQCRICGEPISPTAHPMQKARHVCGPRCNDRLKRLHKRELAREEEPTARLEHEPDPDNPRTILYQPHVQWTSPGGRGYAECLWNGVRGGYVITFGTGMTKVGRSESAGKRLSTHFKHCENYGVEVIDVAVISSAGDLMLMEQSLKRFIKDYPSARTVVASFP
jgi:hypothetical protein